MFSSFSASRGAFKSGWTMVVQVIKLSRPTEDITVSYKQSRLVMIQRLRGILFYIYSTSNLGCLAKPWSSRIFFVFLSCCSFRPCGWECCLPSSSAECHGPWVYSSKPFHLHPLASSACDLDSTLLFRNFGTWNIFLKSFDDKSEQDFFWNGNHNPEI